jgi:hypothetical protein
MITSFAIARCGRCLPTYRPRHGATTSEHVDCIVVNDVLEQMMSE